MARENRRLNVSDRQVAVALVLLVATLIVALIAGETGAMFTKTATNPGNAIAALRVDPPAAQAAPVSAAAGAVMLSWSATPTSAGAGHTLDYLVMRGPVGGPYAQVGATASLALTDTPPADGIYAYVIQARVTGGGGQLLARLDEQLRRLSEWHVDIYLHRRGGDRHLQLLRDRRG
jgi:hypothetical protein